MGPVPLVCDASSNFLTRPIDIAKVCTTTIGDLSWNFRTEWPVFVVIIGSL